jgi:hypothetical protein
MSFCSSLGIKQAMITAYHPQTKAHGKSLQATERQPPSTSGWRGLASPSPLGPVGVTCSSQGD